VTYRVHQFTLRMTRDRDRLESLLNRLDGEAVAIIPKVTTVPATVVHFVLIVETLLDPFGDEDRQGPVGASRGSPIRARGITGRTSRSASTADAHHHWHLAWRGAPGRC
jgi:hypothetical protein